MSERDFYNRRVNRLHLLNNNDRFILNIYLEMYNQTIHDINIMYQDIDLMYQNIGELRNIINNITGVADMTEDRNRAREIDRERVRIRSRSGHNDSENTQRRQRRRTDNGDDFYDNIHNIFYTTNRVDDYNRRTTTIPNIFQRLYGEQTNHRTNAAPTRPFGVGVGVGLGDLLLGFYDNVPVYPSRDQINNGTLRILYSNIENPLNSSCPITLENFDHVDNVSQILGCGHIFNHDSLNSWFRNHVRCPVCRYDIRNYIPRGEPFIQEINTSRRSIPLGDQEDNREESETTENNDDEIPVNHSIDETQSSAWSTLHTTANNEEPRTEGELINNLTNITENLIQNLLNNNSQSGGGLELFNEIVYNLPYIDPSSNDIVFEGYIQNNYRM